MRDDISVVGESTDIRDFLATDKWTPRDKDNSGLLDEISSESSRKWISSGKENDKVVMDNSLQDDVCSKFTWSIHRPAESYP